MIYESKSMIPPGGAPESAAKVNLRSPHEPGFSRMLPGEAGQERKGYGRTGQKNGCLVRR